MPVHMHVHVHVLLLYIYYRYLSGIHNSIIIDVLKIYVLVVKFKCPTCTCTGYELAMIMCIYMYIVCQVYMCWDKKRYLGIYPT